MRRKCSEEERAAAAAEEKEREGVFYSGEFVSDLSSLRGGECIAPTRREFGEVTNSVLSRAAAWGPRL